MATHQTQYDWQEHGAGIISDDHGNDFPAQLYDAVSWRVGNQRRVADAWARCKIPIRADTYDGNTTPMFVSTSRNFRGIQRQDGSGRLKHYQTTEGIRTISQMFLNNSECWAKGHAHCTTPQRAILGERSTLPLTTIESMADDVTHRKRDPRYITDVIEGVEADDDGYDRLVVYESGEAFRASKRDIDTDPLSELDATSFLDEVSRSQ